MHPRHVEKGTGKITSLIKKKCVHCITLYHKLASLDYYVCSDALNFFRDGLHNCDNNATPVL